MADVKYCDLCNTVIESLDRLYFVSYGEKKESLMGFGGPKPESKEICRDCVLEINKFTKTIKKSK